MSYEEKPTLLTSVTGASSSTCSPIVGDVEAIGCKEGVAGEQGGLQRKLKARHVQMIAIASNIGTGLFLGSGKALHAGGPFALVAGYVLIAVVLSIMMQCLGEMTTVLPMPGGLVGLANRFLGRDVGFALGWQYWLAWVSVFGAEAAAFTILLQYWLPAPHLVPLWISFFILITILIHICPVRIFGEVEFVVSTVKVIAVILFICVMGAIIGGAGPNGKRHTGEMWRLEGLDVVGLNNGFRGLASVFVLAAFAAGGIEMVGVMAGEIEHPKWTLPRAIKTLMWRIAAFYILSMALLTFVVPYNAPGLIGSKDANASPFVIAVKMAGIKVLPDVLNAVLVISVCSVGSTSVYISSRTLKAMAEDGFAPKFCARTDKQGRPWVALLGTGAAAIVLAYLNVSSTGAVVFGWFSSISGMAFFLAWLVIICCNWRFHAALKVQGDETLSRRFAYRAFCWPWLSYFAFMAILFMVTCQLIVSVWPIEGKASASTFFSGFLGVPIFLVMWIGYRIICRTKWTKLADIDLQTGRIPDDPAETAKLEHYAGLSRGRKLISYLHF